MIAIIDYGAGNLFSVQNALDYLGFKNCIASDVKALETADKLILPGVGAFPDAMERLQKSGLIPTIKAEVQKKPLLGICLGMQILFEKGYEFTECEGLGLIEGSVVRLEANGLKIPHMGWNDLTFATPCALLDEIAEHSYVYFVHSYGARTASENIAAYTVYGQQVVAVAHKGYVYGTQFHPEKSGGVGLKMLENFCKL